MYAPRTAFLGPRVIMFRFKNHDPPPGNGSSRSAGTPHPHRRRDRRLLFCPGPLHWLVSERPGQYRRRLLHGRPGDDRMGRRPQLSLRQSRRAGTDGLGRLSLPVRHSRHALVLDRRHSGHAVSGAGHDAVLLHLQNSLRAGISEAPLRRTQPRPLRRFLRLHDRAHERRQHVRHGQGHANRSGMGHQFQHLGLLAHRRHLCVIGRAALGHL